MSRRAGAKLPLARLTILVLVTVTGIAVLGYQHLSAVSPPLAFSFTTGGPIMSYGTVEIRADGSERMVTAAPCLDLANPHGRVSRGGLARLTRLVHIVRFASLPPLIRSSRRSLDMSGHTISVYAPTRTITVVEAPDAGNPQFDRLYTALADAAPFTSDACPPPAS